MPSSSGNLFGHASQELAAAQFLASRAGLAELQACEQHLAMAMESMKQIEGLLNGGAGVELAPDVHDELLIRGAELKEYIETVTTLLEGAGEFCSGWMNIAEAESAYSPTGQLGGFPAHGPRLVERA